MKVLFLAICLLLTHYCFAQHVYSIRADTVRIYNTCDTAELVLENRTKDTLGFLFNKGNGRTEFRKLKLISVGSKSIAIEGQDTLELGNYIQRQYTSAQTGSNFWIDGIGRSQGGRFLVQKDGSNTINPTFQLINAANNMGANLQLTADATPGLAAFVHDGTSWVERMRITAAGGVGIGTTTPMFDGLHVMKAASSIISQNTGAYGITSGGFMGVFNSGTPTATDQRLGVIAFGSGPAGNPVRGSAGIMGYSEGAWTDNVSHPSNLRFVTANSGANSATEKMRITAAGGVGIGTTTPAFDGLHVLKNIGVIMVQSSVAYGTTSGGYFEAYNSGTPSAANQRLGSLVFGSIPTGTTVRPSAQVDAFSEAAWTDGTSQPSNLRFLTTVSAANNPSEKMRITAAGNVGIGTTAPSTLLHVAGAGTFNGSLSVGAGTASITSAGNASFTALSVSGNTTFSANGTPGAGKIPVGTDASGNWTWQTQGTGAVYRSITVIQTGNYTIGTADYTILVNPSAGGFTITVPAAAANSGRVLVLRNLSATNSMTLSISFVGYSGNINLLPGATSYMIQSNGTNWYQLTN